MTLWPDGSDAAHARLPLADHLPLWGKARHLDLKSLDRIPDLPVAEGADRRRA
ncbi:MAG: hypothetical protein Kilf2KO_43700 [Rhodospirillales bacterium]